MKKSYQDLAILLRKSGYSYSLIAKKVPVAKSTLSRWLKDIPYEPNDEVQRKIGKALAASGKKKHAQKLDSYKEASILATEDLATQKNTGLLYLGLGIYIGEGEKNDTVGIANSSPDVIVTTMKWLIQCYGLSITNFTLAVHLYPDNDIASAELYWSKVTGIPVSQFGKVQIDRRKHKSKLRYKRLPFGTAHLRVKSNGKKEFGVLLSRRIEESIKIVLNAYT